MSAGIRVNAEDAYWLVDPLDGTRGFATGGKISPSISVSSDTPARFWASWPFPATA